MPNWCSNNMTINGDERTIANIKSMLYNLRPIDASVIQELENELKMRLELVQDATKQADIRNEYERKIMVVKTKIENATGKKGVFRTLIGVDDTMTEQEYDNDWYNNNVRWFGTKWDIDFDEWQWDFEDNYISVNFETAWSPPCAFVTTLVRKYPGITEVELTYEECGCDFAGKMNVTRDEVTGEIYENDDCHSYEEGLYLYDNEYFWMRVEEDVIENELSDNELSLEDVLERFAFVTDADKEEITKMVNEKLEELKLEANEQEA